MITNELTDEVINSDFNFKILQNKILKIDTNNRIYKDVDFFCGKEDISVGVIYNIQTYFLPICTLYSAKPDYSPKKISFF
jgi:hypothetical protein